VGLQQLDKGFFDLVAGVFAAFVVFYVHNFSIIPTVVVELMIVLWVRKHYTIVVLKTQVLE
jgi:hypothetical protein